MTHSACRIAVSARSKKLAVSGVSWAAGSYAVNPANRERIPIWVADYVLGSYGSGAIMAVPAHDARDHEFARVFDLPIRRVVSAGSSEEDQLPYASEPSFLPSACTEARLVACRHTHGITLSTGCHVACADRCRTGRRVRFQQQRHRPGPGRPQHRRG